MTTMITEVVDLEAMIFRSPIDGKLVVQIDSGPDAGAIRVSLNDGPIWDGDPEDDESAMHALGVVDGLVSQLSQALGPPSTLNDKVQDILNDIDDQIREFRKRGWD